MNHIFATGDCCAYVWSVHIVLCAGTGVPVFRRSSRSRNPA